MSAEPSLEADLTQFFRDAVTTYNANIEKLLEDPAQRMFVYWTWRNIVEKEMGEGGSESVVVTALKWFARVTSTHGLNFDEAFVERMRIVSTLRVLETAPSAAVSTLAAHVASELEHARDVFHATLADVGPWLDAHNPMQATGSRSARGWMVSTLVMASYELLLLPFAAPPTGTLLPSIARLDSLVAAINTRAETYVAAFDLISTFHQCVVDCVESESYSSEGDTASTSVLASPRSPAAVDAGIPGIVVRVPTIDEMRRSLSGHLLDSGAGVGTPLPRDMRTDEVETPVSNDDMPDTPITVLAFSPPAQNTNDTNKSLDTPRVPPQATHLLKKIEWLASWSRAALREYPPSPFLVKSLLESLDEVSTRDNDFLDGAVQPALQRFREGLLQVERKQKEQMMGVAGPATPVSPLLVGGGSRKRAARTPLFFQKNHPQNMSNSSFLLDDLSAAPRYPMLSDQDAAGRRLGILHTKSGHGDDRPDLTRHASGLHTAVEADCVGSVDDIWLQVDPVANRLITAQSQNMILEEILTSAASGRLMFTSTHIVWLGRRISDGKLKDHGLLEPALSVDYHDITQFTMQDMGDKASFFLAVYGREVYKFFPFHRGEVRSLCDSLQALTGLEPFDEDTYVKSILKANLEKQRAQILADLIKEPSPWLTRSEHVRELVKNSANKQKEEEGLFYDMERLFHSCRLNSEVTKEAVSVIKTEWAEATSEVVHHRLLALVDRLLDRSVMHVGDPVFHELTRWLQMVEHSLDPYRSARSVRIMSSLRHKYTDMQRQRVAPLSSAAVDSQFTYWQAYDAFLEKYGIV